MTPVFASILKAPFELFDKLYVMDLLLVLSDQAVMPIEGLSKILPIIIFSLLSISAG